MSPRFAQKPESLAQKGHGNALFIAESDQFTSMKMVLRLEVGGHLLKSIRTILERKQTVID